MEVGHISFGHNDCIVFVVHGIVVFSHEYVVQSGPWHPLNCIIPFQILDMYFEI